MEASSPHSTFAAAAQGNVVNNETLLFPGGIFPTWPCIHGLASTLGCLPDPSHSYSTVCMLLECVSTAQKRTAATPAKINVEFTKDSHKFFGRRMAVCRPRIWNNRLDKWQLITIYHPWWLENTCFISFNLLLQVTKDIDRSSWYGWWLSMCQMCVDALESWEGKKVGLPVCQEHTFSFFSGCLDFRHIPEPLSVTFLSIDIWPLGSFYISDCAIGITSAIITIHFQVIYI